ncbi:unnamed protein product [Rotaria sordida]|uniref:F-box domain-containing protein n=1 Tax=Rotaria sordida TaxID=392033 RepID=A0A814QGE6_9BILA|nr:unnamed protein product [Rotaria sordida]CAF4054061.1 unnamed protein product [Rotaria sordida]
MNEYQSQLNDLPNELLNDIFIYFDARELFEIFYNINSRFNKLVQSFNHLQLIFHIKTSNDSETNGKIFSSYVYTLIIDRGINVNLTQFPNVRRLYLINPLQEVCTQLTSDVMPYLEHLSISVANHLTIGILLEKIFSNYFPKLISCELLKIRTAKTIQNWTQIPLLKVLKMTLMNSHVYAAILSACPNLYFFKFSMLTRDEPLSIIQLHTNLKHMIINDRHNEWPNNSHIISSFLACVPNLEYLSVHRIFYLSNVTKYLYSYDWLASIIADHLPLLKQFKFYFHVWNDGIVITSNLKNILCKIQNNFINTHKRQYKARLIIDQK